MCGHGPQSLLAMCKAGPWAESREQVSLLLAPALCTPLAHNLCASSDASGQAMVQLSERIRWRGHHSGRSIGATGQLITTRPGKSMMHIPGGGSLVDTDRGSRDLCRPVDSKRPGTWRRFSLRELHAATNNFNYDNKLGEGAMGSVYWGQLASGDQIAVKRLKLWSAKAEREFAVEIEILGRVRHKHLLSLLGYCAEGQERLIVYEYMPQLSVYSHLHGHIAADSTLNWEQRMKIAVGTAEGLAYLHHYATPNVIHRNIKASNILLDDSLGALVADFGLAKLIPEGSLHKGSKGISGYSAPKLGKVFESCDVFSFGILLMELISGRKPIARVSGENQAIMEWAGPLVLEGRFHDLVDAKLEGKFHKDELIRLVQVAVLCAQSFPEERPSMQDVVEMLKEGGQELVKPPLQHGRDGLRPDEPVIYKTTAVATDVKTLKSEQLG